MQETYGMPEGEYKIKQEEGQYRSKKEGEEHDEEKDEEDQDQDENYELMPRQSQLLQLRPDSQVQYFSKPYIVPAHLVIQNRFPSAGSSHITNKTLQDLNLKYAESQQQDSITKHQKELNQSFVSKSSQNKEIGKQKQKTQDLTISKQQHNFNLLSNIREIQEIQPDKPFHNHQNFAQNRYLNGKKVVSIDESQQLQFQENQEVLYKYHFQTQKQCVRTQIVRQNKTDFVGFTTSLESISERHVTSKNFIQIQPQKMYISPDRKEVKQQNQSKFQFHPYIDVKQKHKNLSDPYIQYKRSAQSSPIMIDKQSSASIQKHSGFDKNNSGTQRNFFVFDHLNPPIQQSPLKFQQSNDYITTLQIQNNQFQRQLIYSQKELIKSMQEIDCLRKDLVKSTENNINAIFNANLTEECCVAETMKGVKSKMNQLCRKIERLQDKRVERLEKEIQSMKNQQHQKRETNYNSRGQNMIIDFGKNGCSEGKIIAIYPNNKMVNIKDLMFGYGNNRQAELQKNYHEKQRILKMMLEMQENFFKTLQKFQEQVNASIQKKLQQVKATYSEGRNLTKGGQYDISEKMQRISQQTNDRQEQFDDSRGSINVLYLKKLRELQEQIKENKWKVQRLEKENYYLEKQLEKVQKIGANNHTVKDTNAKYHGYTEKIQNLYINEERNNRNLSDPNFKLHDNQNLGYKFDDPISLNFSKNKHSAHKSVSSSQKSQQKIKQITALTSQQLQFLSLNNNMLNKKKNTHSFHHQSKNLQDLQLQKMKEKVDQYELALKQKDLRIRELQNTIMDHLQSSRKWKNSQVGSSASSITGYSSVSSLQQNLELLHMKIKNLKTLLKESKKQTEHFKKLFQNQRSFSRNPTSQQTLHMQTKLGQDLISNTSKSMCVSQKTTIRNERNIGNKKMPSDDSNNKKQPFAQIAQSSGLKNSNNQQLEHFQMSNSMGNRQHVNLPNIIEVLVNFILMAWSLKDILSQLCGKDVNIQKINLNAHHFMQELRKTEENVWKNVYRKVQCSQFSASIIPVWFV